MVQFFKANFPFSGITFKIIAENLSFRCNSPKNCENFFPLSTWNAILSTTPCVFITFELLSRGARGECYFTASMQRVDSILEFNFLSGSNFLSRLVLQVISVSFVV